VSVIASELTAGKEIWPLTVEASPAVATVGQFTTRGPPGVVSVRLLGWPLTVARLNVPLAEGSRGPIATRFPNPNAVIPGFCGSFVKRALPPPKLIIPLPPLDVKLVGLLVTSNVPPTEHG
jgi:hypothetical protein